jgi:hypothetical protein
MDNINELFALPVGLKQVANVDGFPLYGSQTLRDKFIQAISDSPRTKDLSESIKKLVDTNVIIPCFADPGLLSYFRRRIAKDTSGGLVRILKFVLFTPDLSQLDYVLAFYHYRENKIFVLISNHIESKNLFKIEVADDAIATSLTHEIMHMFAHTQPNKFISLFEDELTAYYSDYFTRIFKLNDDKKIENVVQQFYKFMFFEVEMKMVTITTLPIPNMLKILKKFQLFSNLNKDEFNSVLQDFIHMSRLLFENDLLRVIGMLRKRFKYLVKPFYMSYKKNFGKIPDKGCTQELYYPSEVICGLSDIKLSKKIKNSIKSAS